MKTSVLITYGMTILFLALAPACGSEDDPWQKDTPAGDEVGPDIDYDSNDSIAADVPDSPDFPEVPELADTTWEDICGEEDLNLQYEVSSDVLIVLDRSGSMMGLLGRVETAINTIAAASDDKIWFGLMPFPNSVTPDECRLLNPFSECYAPTTPHVTLGINRAPDIATVLGGLGICGSTPTTQTLINAHAYLNATVTGHTKYILLATDGVPNCNSSLDPDTCVCLDTESGCEGRPEACLDDEACYDALDGLLADGIKTYVIGMGTWMGTDSEIMESMAVHGGTEHFYPAEAPAELLAVFEEIMGTVVLSCRFDLNPSEFVDPTKVNFYIDGEVVPRDTSHTSGWDYVDEDTIEFYGAWCDRILSGDISGVTATYGCPTIVI